MRAANNPLLALLPDLTVLIRALGQEHCAECSEQHLATKKPPGSGGFVLGGQYGQPHLASWFWRGRRAQTVQEVARPGYCARIASLDFVSDF